MKVIRRNGAADCTKLLGFAQPTGTETIGASSLDSVVPQGELTMKQLDKLDFSKLLGFATVSEDLQGRINFQDASIGPKLGAKVGDKDLATLDLPAQHVGLRPRVPEHPE